MNAYYVVIQDIRLPSGRTRQTFYRPERFQPFCNRLQDAEVIETYDAANRIASDYANVGAYVGRVELRPVPVRESEHVEVEMDGIKVW